MGLPSRVLEPELALLLLQLELGLAQAELALLMSQMALQDNHTKSPEKSASGCRHSDKI